ncbi:MAG: hypothetical protein J6A29_00855 [Clostridia bacterium]|nr:hypothetical protein [Clostridia bacterium]
MHTYIRNQIHHQADNGKALVVDLETSIKIMRNYLQYWKKIKKLSVLS